MRERHAEQETALAARTGNNEAMRWDVVERCNAIDLSGSFSEWPPWNSMSGKNSEIGR